jgi:hypothetical protein
VPRLFCVILKARHDPFAIGGSDSLFALKIMAEAPNGGVPPAERGQNCCRNTTHPDNLS